MVEHESSIVIPWNRAGLLHHGVSDRSNSSRMAWNQAHVATSWCGYSTSQTAGIAFSPSSRVLFTVHCLT